MNGNSFIVFLLDDTADSLSQAEVAQILLSPPLYVAHLLPFLPHNVVLPQIGVADSFQLLAVAAPRLSVESEPPTSVFAAPQCTIAKLHL